MEDSCWWICFATISCSSWIGRGCQEGGYAQKGLNSGTKHDSPSFPVPPRERAKNRPSVQPVISCLIPSYGTLFFCTSLLHSLCKNFIPGLDIPFSCLYTFLWEKRNRQVTTGRRKSVELDSRLKRAPTTFPPSADEGASSDIMATNNMPLPPDDNIAWKVWVGSIVSVVLATVAVVARLTARKLSAARFWWDDHLIAMALVRSP